MGKDDHRGRSKNEHGTFIQRSLMETAAWRAMSPKAQMLYIWLRLEWKGAKFNNNGKIKLSCRQAARCLGVSENTAMRAFHELQEKGFVVVTKLGALGIEGEARGPSLELTNIGMANDRPRNLFLDWSPSKKFEVARHPANNPSGRRGNQNPVSIT